MTPVDGLWASACMCTHVPLFMHTHTHTKHKYFLQSYLRSEGRNMQKPKIASEEQSQGSSRAAQDLSQSLRLQVQVGPFSAQQPRTGQAPGHELSCGDVPASLAYPHMADCDSPSVSPNVLYILLTSPAADSCLCT